MFIVKKCRISFLLFLVMFSHSCFASPIKSIDNIISSEKFKNIEIFLNTKTGQYTAQFILTYTNTILWVTMLSTGFYFVLGKFESNASSSISRYEKKPGEKSYTFDKDYFGNIPIDVKRLINWFKDPSVYKELLDKEHLLFVGHPGVGKSYLTRIIADEVNVPMYVLDGSTAQGGMFRGTGAALLQKVFNDAKKEETGAIIMIDEFDAICRNKGLIEDNEAIKKLQVLMDGFESNSKVKVIALSNEPNKLSKAVRRRFKIVSIKKLDSENRKNFFSFLINRYIEQEQHIQDPRINNLLVDLAKKTENFSQDDMTKVIKSVFIKVMECANDSKIEGENYKGIIEDRDKTFTIEKEVFLKEIDSMRCKREVGESNFLFNEEDTIPENILYSMYS